MSLIVASVGCGGKPVPEKPQLILDRDSIGFGQEFSSTTRIGTAPQESLLLLSNGGLADLVISSVTYSGDSAFMVSGPVKVGADGKTIIKGKDSDYLRIVFTPLAEKLYSGSITIVSNAENYPTKVVKVSGKAAFPSDGGTDGGP